ncbi:MAG TPA: hypothetical protein VLB72_11605 [Burkholderiales bacterium]|nr:hypothetical protein [Burkholderiales bacterium]
MPRTATPLLLAISLTLLPVMNAHGQSRASELSTLRDAIEGSVAAFSRGPSANAFNELLKEHWFKSTEAQSTATTLDAALQANRGAAELRLGKAIPGAYEFLGVRRLGASVAKLVYVLKHEHGVIPLVFDCYRAGDVWRILGVHYGDSAMDDMKTLAVVERSN